MTLPNFLFLGPDKSGSTWLQRTLSKHPQVFLPAAKDTYFFTQEYGRGIEWYASHFRTAGPDARVVGEICHDYLTDERAAARIREVLPESRLMVCLREPVSRSFSAYLNMQRNGWDIGSFSEAMDRHPELVDNSRYAKHLGRVLDLFPAEQLLVAWFDALQESPQRFLDEVTGHLGIEPMVLREAEAEPSRPAATARSAVVARTVKQLAVASRRVGFDGLVGRVKTRSAVQSLLYKNIAPGGRQVDEGDADRIRAAVRDDVARLEQLLGRAVPDGWS